MPSVKNKQLLHHIPPRSIPNISTQRHREHAFLLRFNAGYYSGEIGAIGQADLLHLYKGGRGGVGLGVGVYFNRQDVWRTVGAGSEGDGGGVVALIRWWGSSCSDQMVG